MLRKRVFLAGIFLSGALLAQDVVVSPTGSQNIAQPPSTSLNVNNVASGASFEHSYAYTRRGWLRGAARRVKFRNPVQHDRILGYGNL
jgi:hypothetical protein